MLEINQLNQFYGQSHTLWDVDLTLNEGDCMALMGRNGVGKTTLLNCIMGLIQVKSGGLMFDGNDMLKLSAEKRAPLGVGYVPQGRMIFPLMTVEDNLRIGLPARSDGEKKIPDRVFEIFPVLKDMLHRRGGDLSGGQQQQLAIGRALVIDPKILILDEPCEGIQPNIVQLIGEVITRLNEEFGMTVLLVEQKLPFVRKFVKTFSIMEKGRVVSVGAIGDLNDRLIKQHLTV